MQSINFFRRYRDLLVVLLLLALPFVFYVSNSKQTRDHNLFDKAVVLVSAPVQWVVVSALDTVSDVWHHYVNLIDVQADNDRLKRENARLDAELAEREEQRLENERLRLLVGLQRRQPEVKMVFAQVIATSPTPLFRSVRIDRGRRDGLEIGAAVVSYHGVVGRVAALSEFYADVMLLVDSSSSTDVLVQRTRARARVRGQGGDDDLGVEAQYLPRTADVEPSDILVTSGLGRTFPRGLRVGKVISVERRAFGLYQRAIVQPSVDFARLESLMVILKGYPERADFDTPETSESPESNEAWESDLPELPLPQKPANPLDPMLVPLPSSVPEPVIPPPAQPPRPAAPPAPGALPMPIEMTDPPEPIAPGAAGAPPSPLKTPPLAPAQGPTQAEIPNTSPIEASPDAPAPQGNLSPPENDARSGASSPEPQRPALPAAQRGVAPEASPEPHDEE